MNMGKRNSIKSRVLVKNHDMYFVGCCCHMAHNTAHKGGNSFSGASRFDVEDLVVDLLLIWQNTKCKNELNKFWNIYPHVGLTYKRQFVVRWKCTNPWKKLFFVKLRKAAKVSMTNKTVWKSYNRSIFTLEGISNIIICFITPANSSEFPYCLPDPFSHSETPKSLDSSVLSA